MQETWQLQVQSLDQEDPLEEEMATHSSILAWRIPWTDEPGRLQSMGLQSRTWLKLLSMHKQGPLDPKAFWSKFLLYPDCRLYGSLSYHSLNAAGTLYWILMVILLGKHHDFHFTNKQRRQVTSLRLGREKAGPYLPGAKGWCWAGLRNAPSVKSS